MHLPVIDTEHIPGPCGSIGRALSHRRTPMGRRNGLTLVEVMVASVIMAATLLAYLGAFIQAYKMEEDARRRNQARAVLQSAVEDFMRRPIVDSSKSVDPLFYVSPMMTGNGLKWRDPSGTEIVGTVDGLKIRLGGDPTAPLITVLHQVWQVNETATVGTPDTALTDSGNSGRQIAGEFVAEYTVNGRKTSLSMWALRTDAP